MRPLNLRPGGVNEAPGAAAEEHRHKPGCSRWHHIIVDAITDVRDLRWLKPELFNHALEESGVWLLDTPTLGAGDKVEGQLTTREKPLGRRWLIRSHGKEVPGVSQHLEARSYVRVKICFLVVEKLTLSWLGT